MALFELPVSFMPPISGTSGKGERGVYRTLTDDGILAGHARVLAARKLGMKEVPVIVLRHLAEAQKRALVIADNQLAIAGAGWDEEMLRIELAILHEEDYNVDLLGVCRDEKTDADL
jgi:ParB-like chromosome segregation protein Spo0J